jgi:hypothetical protein
LRILALEDQIEYVGDNTKNQSGNDDYDVDLGVMVRWHASLQRRAGLFAGERRARNIRLPVWHVKREPERLESLGTKALSLVVRQLTWLLRILDRAVVLVEHTLIVAPDFARPQWVLSNPVSYSTITGRSCGGPVIAD